MARYLVDTCVWRDFHEGRRNRQGAPLGRFAAAAFLRMLKRKSEILICRLLVKELERDYPRSEVEGLLGFVSATGQLRWTEPTDEQTQQARRLAMIRALPFADCLFAVLAREADAVVITRDRHFFTRLSDVAVAIRPEELG